MSRWHDKTSVYLSMRANWSMLEGMLTGLTSSSSAFADLVSAFDVDGVGWTSYISSTSVLP
ncbi:hypothetical protein BT96DRAFT_919179, partial [Gymnopus androsaceus JB14]